MLEDDNAIADKSGTLVSSGWLQIGPAHTFTAHTKEKSKMPNSLDPPTAHKAPTENFDQSSCPERALPQHQSEPVVRKDDHKVATVAKPPSPTPVLLSEQSKARVSALE